MNTDIFANGFDLNALTGIVFKVVAILLSVFYLLYSIVLARQIKVMGRTLESASNGFIYIMSSIQVAAAFILIIFSVFLL